MHVNLLSHSLCLRRIGIKNNMAISQQIQGFVSACYIAIVSCKLFDIILEI